MRTSPQLQLFPDQLVTWETLPQNCQQSIRELLSLLLEQSLQQQRHESQTNQPEEGNHV
jgi:hypothetical protein